MVGEIVNNIRAVLILILGLLIGLAFGFLGPVVGLGLVAGITAYIMIVSSPDVAICVLTGYAVIDWALRLVAEALAGAWDELYLVVLILIWIYKWISARNGETIKVTSMDLPIIIFIGVMLFALIINSTDYSISLEGFRAIVQYLVFCSSSACKWRKECKEGNHGICYCHRCYGNAWCVPVYYWCRNAGRLG